MCVCIKSIHCCCCSVTQSCPTLCDPMDGSTPGLPVPHHLPEFAQVHLHCIGDAVQPSHPLMPSSHSTLNLSQHQGLFCWVNSLYQMTKILEFQFQHPVFPMSQLFTLGSQNTRASASASVLSTSTQGRFPLRLTGLISLLPKGLSRIFPITTVWRDQFSGILPSIFCPALTTIHDHWEDHSLD